MVLLWLTLLLLSLIRGLLFRETLHFHFLYFFRRNKSAQKRSDVLLKLQMVYLSSLRKKISTEIKIRTIRFRCEEEKATRQERNVILKVGSY